MTAEKKKYEFMRIIALDGSTIYRSKKLTALKDGKTNAHAFSGVLDDSLETIKLREIYAKHEAEIGYPYLEDKAFCRAIVSGYDGVERLRTFCGYCFGSGFVAGVYCLDFK